VGAVAEIERIALRRATAVIGGDAIVVRPSRGQLLAPLIQLAIAGGAVALIVLFLDGLPFALLVVLLLVAVFLGPVAALGFVFGLFGSSMVVDGAKRSAHWQQGFLGLGIGTTSSVPFERIAHIEVGGDYDDDFTYSGRPDVVSWDIELVRDDGKRLEVGSVLAARPLADEGLARANRLASAVGALAGCEVRAGELPFEALEDIEGLEDEAAAAGRTEQAGPRRRRRRLERATLPPPNEASR
jgi:hypothetical protein